MFSGTVNTAGKNKTSSHVNVGSNSLQTRLTYLWLLGSVAHTCPWSPHCHSGSLCLGEEQGGTEQVPQLTARRSGVVGKHNGTKGAEILDCMRSELKGRSHCCTSATSHRQALQGVLSSPGMGTSGSAVPSSLVRGTYLQCRCSAHRSPPPADPACADLVPAPCQQLHLSPAPGLRKEKRGCVKFCI